MPYPPQPIPGGFNPDLSSFTGGASGGIGPDGAPVIAPSTTITIFGRAMPYNEALAFWNKMQDGLTTDQRNQILVSAGKFYNRNPADIASSMPNFWANMVTWAASNKVPVEQQIDFSVAQATAVDTGTARLGDIPTVTTTYDRMSKRSATSLLNQMMTSYLGRAARQGERERFMAALRKEEQDNPLVVSNTGGSTSTTTRTGGFSDRDATLFAQDWASSRKGALEYTAGTKVWNLFTNALGA